MRLPVAKRPQIGDTAPDSPALRCPPGWRLVAFLRHVGCPFAEHTVKRLRNWAQAHPEAMVVVVSHGDADVTAQWLTRIGGLGPLVLVHDPDRALYAQWGLAETRLLHFAGLPSLMGVVRLWAQGIRNRDASGTRWQAAGMFLTAGPRVVWSHVPHSAQEFALPPDTVLAATIRPARPLHR